ncbi:hypothetical protein ACFY1U_01135, partial [Streptomyces sp. NPDC001351]|uniref:hypothetical protein n=1 Tax=Streptomyces sp. NPDC001351 TaxID=3364564 RepID=UPI0036A58E14
TGLVDREWDDIGVGATHAESLGCVRTIAEAVLGGSWWSSSAPRGSRPQRLAVRCASAIRCPGLVDREWDDIGVGATHAESLGCVRTIAEAVLGGSWWSSSAPRGSRPQRLAVRCANTTTFPS